jgi:hypothetical protein
MAEGRKYDGDKLRYDLIPVGPLAEVAKVYTIGAKKYADRAVCMVLSNDMLRLIGVANDWTPKMGSIIWLVLFGALWLLWSMSPPAQS